jgi:endo-1,4-beta-xylanase
MQRTINNLLFGCLFLGLTGGMLSCKKDGVGILNTGNFRDTTGGPLKSANDFLFGMAVQYDQMSGNATLASLVSKEASAVTFGNELKYGSVVGNDGSFNYTTADAFYNLCANAGLQVYGHTLSWYQQNNTNYLNAVIGGAASSAAPNLLPNGDFETLGGSLFASWGVYNPGGNTGGNGQFAVNTVAGNLHGGSNSLQVNVTTGGTNWKVQMSSGSFTTVVGHKYNVSFWIKAANGPGSEQVEFQYDAPSGTGAQYSGDMNNTTSWAQVNLSFTAAGTTARLVFDMGLNVDTYYIDDVAVTDASAINTGSSPQTNRAVDSVFGLWVTSTVSHFAGKIKAWDVVNEPMSDGNGALRTSKNAPTLPLPSGQFFWSDYLGRQFGLKAFQYAKAADPNALLFINEYNLESNPAKLDSLIAYVNELKGQGAQIDGIGTQMHITTLTSDTGIDRAFRKLAATGLKVRISELDVRLNPNNQANFLSLPVDPTLLAFQADKYKYVVSSYIRNVPAAQRYGITVWGVDDPESWIITSQKLQDAPLLFDKNFGKKPAYSGYIQGSQKGK